MKIYIVILTTSTDLQSIIKSYEIQLAIICYSFYFKYCFVQKSQRDYEERSRGGGRGGRGGRRLGDFFTNDRQHGQDSRRGQSSRRGQDSRRGGRNDYNQDERRVGRGGFRQNRGNSHQNDYDDDNYSKKSQDVRLRNSNQEEWPSLNQKKTDNQSRRNQPNKKQTDQSEDWGDSAATEDWAGNKISSKKYDRNSEQGYPYKNNDRKNKDDSFEDRRNKGGQRNNRDSFDNNDIRNNRNSRGSPNKRDDYQQQGGRRKRNDDNDDNWQPPQRSEEYPNRAENT